MLRRTSRTALVGRNALGKLQPVVLFQRRLISSDEMFEAFGNSNPGSEAKSNNMHTTKTQQSSFVSEKKVDPVININRDFSSSATSHNDQTPNKKEVTSISDVFKSSLNDFDASQKQEVYDKNTKNWSESFHGLGNAPFSKEAQDILHSELPDDDIEITPDGLLYLPEIKYRRILNKAFGAGAWGLAPRGETLVQMQQFGGLLTREYGLVIHGRLVSIARGEQTFFKEAGIPTATEGCKSNALMRCCKDLGIASELWDPRFIKKFKKSNCENIFVEYVPTKKKKKIWKRKDEDVEYPFKR
jgi:hypothetical protein